MNTKEIRQLDEAILYAMQVEERTGFSFREIKRVCKAAMPFITVYKNTDTSGSSFIYEVISNVENLENGGYVKVTRRSKFIIRIDLTERGKELLKNTSFTSKVV